jgi:hypothetical protein
MMIMAIGSALRAVCGDQSALGLTFVEEVWTAPKYRLYSLDDTHAALVEDTEEGASIRGELVELPDERWPDFLASEPPGIAPGPVELADGRIVSAAKGDRADLARRARDITEFGDFARYLAARP